MDRLTLQETEGVGERETEVERKGEGERERDEERERGKNGARQGGREAGRLGTGEGEREGVSVTTTTLSLPLPLSLVLGGSRLVLDVYPGGAELLCRLWRAERGWLLTVETLRLGSESDEKLDEALDIVSQLTLLTTLTIRGGCVCDPEGRPLPGILSTLPPSLSSLSLLTHLDLSFNRLSSLPACLLVLPRLSHLLLARNSLTTLPAWLGDLRPLTFLSVLGNQLTSVPAGVGRLGSLVTLDLSYNNLASLPPEVGQLDRLTTLELSCNRLTHIPDTLGSLLCLRSLSLHSNHLRSVPDSLLQLRSLQMDLRNNPLESGDLTEVHLGYGQHRFCICAAGCRVVLPGGAELVFPRGAVSTATALEWAETRPDRKWVWLDDHDILLSRALELRPHGTAFSEAVSVCVPFCRSRRRGGRDVVIRRFDGQTWTQLPTLTRRGRERAGGRRTQFSWFVVVSVLLQDQCCVSPQGALLLSRADPGVRVTFPPNATLQPCTVTLQVLPVIQAQVRELSGDARASTSPLLCLVQSPALPFLQPVRIQVPLPPGLAGHSVDMSRLVLLRGDSDGQNWTDVTAGAGLTVTQIFALFTVNHFSWYWLWFCARRCVGGVVRRVFERLRMFRVQFLVQQRRSDPRQVLLQCLPTNQIQSAVEALSAQYDGPQPSDLCEMLEGEQFFAGFESGIAVCSDRPDCVGDRLSFVFYSHLKNHKEVHICPSPGQQEPVRGQVSFYRGEMPSSLPAEAAQRRKGRDEQWLTTLPLRLPGDGEGVGLGVWGSEGQPLPPLRLGDPERGYLTEANLLSVSLRLGAEWRTLGLNLGLSFQRLERIQHQHRDDLGAQVLAMLFHWARSEGASAGPGAAQGEGAVARLVSALKDSGRRDLAEEVEDIVRLGTRKYRDSLHRVGLEQRERGGEEEEQQERGRGTLLNGKRRRERETPSQ
ncbi:PIDD1 protein, partial [Amia calva]|nr:PIDD1 protein [Amia calva]